MTQHDGPAPGPRELYGHSLGRLERDYTDFSIWGTRASLYAARLRGEDGHLIGEQLTADTLDGLAERMDAVRRRMDGA